MRAALDVHVLQFLRLSAAYASVIVRSANVQVVANVAYSFANW